MAVFKSFTHTVNSFSYIARVIHTTALFTQQSIGLIFAD
ncbi:hypothetical protein SOHN41_03180 [Shewanella sp. HN-41]|nr:hypothetical protein SOHN41_03180 [Shewanella sp. HN-41]